MCRTGAPRWVPGASVLAIRKQQVLGSNPSVGSTAHAWNRRNKAPDAMSAGFLTPVLTPAGRVRPQAWPWPAVSHDQAMVSAVTDGAVDTGTGDLSLLAEAVGLGLVETATQKLTDRMAELLHPQEELAGLITDAVEAAAVSVAYAVVVEVWLHRALKLRAVPAIFGETGVFLGSFLVILIMALALGEFLEKEEIPTLMVEWIQGKDLEYWQFLLLLNLLLLAVGMMMDILSAMFVFVPLLAPIAASMGVDPMHFGIIFIVNLEIGYLTPPVGLNLFVASALYEKGLGHVIRSVAPFVGLMLIGLGLITWYPQLSIGLGNWIMGDDPNAMVDEDGEKTGGMPTMEEMMQEAMDAEDGDDEDFDDEDFDDEELEDEELEDEEVEQLLEDQEAPEPDSTE